MDYENHERKERQKEAQPEKDEKTSAHTQNKYVCMLTVKSQGQRNIFDSGMAANEEGFCTFHKNIK